MEMRRLQFHMNTKGLCSLKKGNLWKPMIIEGDESEDTKPAQSLRNTKKRK